MSYDQQKIRFDNKVNKLGTLEYPDCWMWEACVSSNGYGSFKLYPKKPSIGAHVASYILYKGDIPNGMIVCHSCDNKFCVNPNHLSLGSHQDNSRDMFAKNRNPWSSRPRTHCRRGHDFSIVGVKYGVKKNGKSYRTCRECIRIFDRNRCRNK
jgi:hypothetical protein